MKRITGFMVALFLVLGIAATNSFAQDDTMKQNNTMTRQNGTMMSKKPMVKKHRRTRKHRKTYHHSHKSKMMKKSSTKQKSLFINFQIRLIEISKTHNSIIQKGDLRRPSFWDKPNIDI